MKEEVKNLPLKNIELSKDNPRSADHKKNGGLAGLKDSIKRMGVRIPIHVRKKGKKYIVVAGERRTLACKQLRMQAIPAIIVDGDEAHAFETTLAENENRVDLSPVEQAEGIKTLLAKHGGKVKAVAEKMGINESQVRLFRAIDLLIPEWKMLADSDELDFSPATLAEIARMPKSIQLDLADRAWQIERMGAKQLTEFIEREYIHTISFALFDTQACEKCENRTTAAKQKDLWDQEDDKKKEIPVRCLDSECWRKKHFNHIAKLVAETIKTDKNLKLRIPTNLSYTLEHALGQQFGQKMIIKYVNDYDTAKKSDAKAFPVMWLEGANAGKIHYLKPKKGKAASAGKGKPKSLKERRKNLRGLRVKIVIEKLLEALRKVERKDCALSNMELVVFVTLNGSKIINHLCPENGDILRLCEEHAANETTVHRASFEPGTKVNTLPVDEVLWFTVRGELCYKVAVENGERALANETFARQVGDIINFDFNAAFKEACEQKPEPKSWKNLKADGTPK